MSLERVEGGVDRQRRRSFSRQSRERVVELPMDTAVDSALPRLADRLGKAGKSSVCSRGIFGRDGEADVVRLEILEEDLGADCTETAVT